jgi:hypothetical protein
MVTESPLPIALRHSSPGKAWLYGSFSAQGRGSSILISFRYTGAGMASIVKTCSFISDLNFAKLLTHSRCCALLFMHDNCATLQPVATDTQSQNSKRIFARGGRSSARQQRSHQRLPMPPRQSNYLAAFSSDYSHSDQSSEHGSGLDIAGLSDHAVTKRRLPSLRKM